MPDYFCHFHLLLCHSHENGNPSFSVIARERGNLNSNPPPLEGGIKVGVKYSHFTPCIYLLLIPIRLIYLSNRITNPIHETFPFDFRIKY